MNFIRISRHLLRPICYGSQAMTRTLFTQETLDSLSYERDRSEILENTESLTQFKWQLMCYLDNEPKKELPVLTKATEILVHIMSPEKDDYALLQQLLKELNKFEDYSEKAKSTYGNLTMKALHTLNAWDTMKELKNNSELSAFFKGFRCTLLYLDLAYKNEDYNEILEMDKQLRDTVWAKQTTFSKYIDVLIFGACYKLNTMESYNHAYALWLGVSESGQFKKTVLFMAALAYKQKQWFAALEISKNLPANPVIDHIKLLTLMEMQYYDEFIECLSSWTTDEKLLKIKLWKETFDKINQMVKDIPSESSRDQVRSILSSLENDGRIVVESFDDHLNRKITSRITVRGDRNKKENKMENGEQLLRN